MIALVLISVVLTLPAVLWTLGSAITLVYGLKNLIRARIERRVTEYLIANPHETPEGREPYVLGGPRDEYAKGLVRNRTFRLVRMVGFLVLGVVAIVWLPQRPPGIELPLATRIFADLLQVVLIGSVYLDLAAEWTADRAERRIAAMGLVARKGEGS